MLGDLNIDLSEESNHPLARSLKQTLSSYNLENVIKNYTRITRTSRTLIDHAITAATNKVIISGSYESCISDHNLIYVVYKLYVKPVPPKLITVKNYRNIDTAQLQRDFYSTPWDLIDLFDDEDDSLWCWEKLFHQTLSDHVKSRKAKVRTNSLCWMNTEIRKALNQRYKLFIQAKNAPKDSPKWKDFKKLRNKCTALIRKARIDYWKNEFEKSSNSKTFWRTVKKFKGIDKQNNIGSLNVNGEVITDPKEKAEAMNSFFANIGKELAQKLPTRENDLSHL